MDNNNKKEFNKIKYNNMYNKEKYKRFNISLKPSMYDDIRIQAEAEGKSIAQYFTDIHIEHKSK